MSEVCHNDERIIRDPSGVSQEEAIFFKDYLIGPEPSIGQS
jgi:hypothetical protein